MLVEDAARWRYRLDTGSVKMKQKLDNLSRL